MVSRATSAAADAPPRILPDWKRAVISAFILFHLFAIACWCMPLNSLIVPKCKEWIRPYMLWTGLFQAWDMFAPDPMKLNSYIDAEVKFRDGKSRIWAFTRMQDLGYAERYFKERYRKFSVEYVRMDANAGMWPDVARYIARTNSDMSNPPVSVRLIRHWSEIGVPERDGGYQPGAWNQYSFFTYPVQPSDLK